MKTSQPDISSTLFRDFESRGDKKIRETVCENMETPFQKNHSKPEHKGKDKDKK